MNPALRLRPLALWLLIAASLMLFAGAGRAAAAQRPHSVAPKRQPIAYAAKMPHAGHHRRPAVAYADGSLTRAPHHRRVIA